MKRSRVARLLLRLMGGWEMHGEIPTETKAVMLAVPHSTNIDGLLLVLLVKSVGLDAQWMVKDTWTKGPIGFLTRRVGAVGVNRGAPGGLVGQMAERFSTEDEFRLLVPPEGTRSKVEHWKSGFYRIAVEADVPVIPAYLDYSTKRGGFGPALMMTGDIPSDMDAIREFYGDPSRMAKHPEKIGPIRLKDEI